MIVNGGTFIGTTLVGQPTSYVTANLQLQLDAATYSGSGTTWYDLSGNGNDVVMQNSSSISYNSGAIKYFSTGSTGWFSRASSTNLPTGNSPYTFSVWVQLASSWGSNGFISIGPFGSGNQANAFRTSGTNAYYNYWWANDLFATSSLSPATQWFNAVAKFDGTTRSIWINGVQRASDTPSGHNVTTSALQIAKTFSSEYLQGNIGQALIYNTALSTADILQNYNATKGQFGL
jgi:hypothetical protein